MLRHFVLALVIFAAPVALAPVAHADTAPVHTGLLSRVAVGGYDPVAYFTDGRPVRGVERFRVTHQGYEYRFANAENLAAFRASPARYLPQYGGYCAWAVSQGYTAAGNPNNWRIVDGRLYLNYNAEIQTRWEGDIPGHIRRANTNWPGVLSR
ncbi:YHS domain-containing (seleno)protein [Terricaulis sp.]|uniref:YHS domain-containing (seleno)protein n=1 Tax=Terricaulis sp. TaxID=2768686 RepID=UPI002AC4F3FE|nr:YHS domain-containing (seleno)protein [Terricaulis sp.]MDZ4692051.1 YHS domain-containing (seleno)protein [Terricaulis sp.]